MVSLKGLLATLAACAVWVQAAPTESFGKLSSLSPRASYVTKSGTSFNIDGSSKYFAGSNAYWIGFLTNNADVDLVMTHLQGSGIKVLRVWGFNDVSSTSSGVWYQSFVPGQPPQINTGADGLERLDYVVSSAAAHDVKLIINFVNNWGTYGGMPLYNTYYGTTATTWYTDSAVQSQYKAYINAVVSRYKTSPAVFAWELANEPRCHGCDTSIITNWATSISSYIKGLDSNHLVTLGDEGWMNGGGDGSYPYTPVEGIDFIANLKVPNLDFGTFHLYPGSWGVSNDFGNDWITNHAAACVAAGKPCVLEEYGVTSDQVSVEASWQATSLVATGMAGDMFWQYGDTLSNGQTANDGYTIYFGSSIYNSLINEHVAAINGGSGTPPPVTTSTTSTTAACTGPTSPTSGTASQWGQCAGQGWSGPTVCASPYSCMYQNPWYSQCL